MFVNFLLVEFSLATYWPVYFRGRFYAHQLGCSGEKGTQFLSGALSPENKMRSSCLIIVKGA